MRIILVTAVTPSLLWQPWPIFWLLTKTLKCDQKCTGVHKTPLLIIKLFDLRNAKLSKFASFKQK